MTDNNKKRSGSFKKFFPNFFIKSKDKSKESILKVPNNVANSNQYHDPRSVIKSDKYDSGSERIYENLTANRHNENDGHSIDLSSNHSSSSTLVSDSLKNRSHGSDVTSVNLNYYAARPQVPPKPHGEMNSPIRSHQREDATQYPSVYYHSMEKLVEKITPLDEYKVYGNSQVQATPTSVGAEIKRVSTKFLISPKKEAEVRTIQPTRARSLSFDIENRTNLQVSNQSGSKTAVKKSYNYSAPTSPIPTHHKIPSMPKTVSPYELVRKNMIEAEEKRNSLSRTSLRNKVTPSVQEFSRLSPISTIQKVNPTLEKEKTRQKVEAFYWQKLKEMKEKEDEYYLVQSLNTSLKIQTPSTYHYSNSSPATPLAVEPRSCSLPRGRDLQNMFNQTQFSSPFVRGAPERRTDTHLKSRTQFTDPEIIYRHPEKLDSSMAQPAQATTPIFQRGSLTRETSIISQPKRVSFDDNSKTRTDSNSDWKMTNDSFNAINQSNVRPANSKNSEVWKGPPRPPVRTTSVGAKSFKLVNNRKIIHLAGMGHSLYSESESGSEAGEIQRILQNKGKQFIVVRLQSKVVEVGYRYNFA